jgi:MarR family transcriptional regulator, multiple gene regulator MgrA
MKIEESIKQKSFPSLALKTSINLVYTASGLTNKHELFFSKFSLTRQQYNTLRIIRGAKENPPTIAIIKDRMVDKMSDASRIVDRLEKAVLVQRKSCDEDKRRVLVHLTKAGEQLLHTMDEHIGGLDDLITNQLSIDEMESLNFLLDKLRGNE